MFYRNWNRHEHGIDRDKMREYWRLQSQTGQTVHLLICEAESGDVLMQSLTTLGSQGNYRKGRDNRSGKWMINWDRGVFAVGTFSVPADDLRNIAVVIAWDEFETSRHANPCCWRIMRMATKPASQGAALTAALMKSAMSFGDQLPGAGLAIDKELRNGLHPEGPLLRAAARRPGAGGYCSAV